MARVRLIHWNAPEGRGRRLGLSALGHEAEFAPLDTPAARRALRVNPPDAFVIDLSRLPSQGREVAMALRTRSATRHVPLIFVDGDPEKVAKLKTLLPDATYTSWGRLKTALARAIARPPAAPFVPPDILYSGKPAVEKLGIKPAMKVGVLGAPKPQIDAAGGRSGGIADLLAPLPAGVTLSARPESACDLFICFVRSQRELATHLVSLARTIDRQTLWMVWPKKASKVPSDLDGNVVRETGLATGWVDFKVCSVDDTWSGLAFKRRR